MKINTPSKILFLSTFPPTQCGIATYTKDTITAITDLFGKTLSCEICDISDKTTVNQNVQYSIHPKIKADYSRVAGEINCDNSIKLVHIQHEFGLFGGTFGNYLLDFLDVLKKPVTFTFHSIIPNPDKKLMAFVKLLISYSNSVIVMTQQSKKILIHDYSIDKNIIECVPHGTHSVNYEKTSFAKRKFNLEHRTVLSTFGLLSSGKSIETAIKALPEIIKHTPNVLYLILGKTHPNTITNNKDDYRDYLDNLVKELKLENHVNFINRYLEIDELLNYLKATDIYLFTSKDPNQAVSGTFAYAMSCACPIVATSISHTNEVLTSKEGRLVAIENSKEMAKETIKLLSDGKLLESMALAAFEKTRASSWENVTLKQVNIYKKSIDKSLEIPYNYPPIKLDHLKNMTTGLGIIQFSKISKPDITSGYTLDDNARALITMCMHYKCFKKSSDLLYINTYLAFIERCQTDSGAFINYVDEHNNNHIKNDYVNLEDSNARAIWALGTVISFKEHLPETIVNKAALCFLKSTEWIKNILSPRAIAFTIKGLYLYYTAEQDKNVVLIIENLSKNLITNYDVNSIKSWNWFENYLTYANSILPEAMLYSYLITGKDSHKRIALESFDFLLSKMFVNGHFKVISNKGWYQKDVIPNEYGEQPIDVSYTIQTLELFYKTFEDSMYKTMMQKAFNWFLGENHLNQIMYDPLTGGCYDGLEKVNVNLNQGAESTICYLMACIIMEEHKAVSSRKVIHLIEPKVNTYLNLSKNQYLNKECN
ncbi:glycosyltransferase [Thalassobellus suaedae]|uniref:Glycosyltransferase n=1 Tax=Thalassobellus suaedae TaxID=3074124 RepID=A0ABY9XPD8_9FLAO|nr:glycosyltransferase [Flavobacteriaceae bacterium HL-DH14]